MTDEAHEKILYSPYAPVRLQHHVWWTFASAAARDGLVTADGKMVLHLPSEIMHGLIQPTLAVLAMRIKELTSDPIMQSHLITQTKAKWMDQRHWVPLVAQFALCGRQIFDLGDRVVELLENTDTGDCTFADWNPPYDSFYVRFGKRDNIRLPFSDDAFEYLDGAFVGVAPFSEDGKQRRIRFGFSTVKEDGRGVDMPGAFIDIHPEEQQLPVPEAVEAALARRLRSLEDQPDDDQQSQALNVYRRAEVQQATAILRQAVHLVVNALFYIESIGTKRRPRPGRDTPTDLVEQWENATDSKRVKLRSKLLSSGYCTVYLMGTEFDGDAGITPAGGAKRTHWRRGHWREQPHGPERAFRKRIWLKPQMIGAERLHDDLPGHIYVVDTPSGNRGQSH